MNGDITSQCFSRNILLNSSCSNDQLWSGVDIYKHGFLLSRALFGNPLGPKA